MIPIIKQVLPVYPTHMHIQWVVDDRDSILGGVEVLRSESPRGPFNSIAKLGSESYNYSDSEVNLLGISKNFWYIIKANPSSLSSEFVLSPPRTVDYPMEGNRAKIARKARRDLKIQLERLNGVPIIILKRRTFGPRCPECFNIRTNDVLYSHCNTCFGTTYKDGYYDPVYTYGKLDPVSIQETIGTSGINESAVTGLTIADYPIVDINDIIIEAKTNRRFKVLRKVQTESSRILVHQDLQVSELSRAGIEYEIPVRLQE